MKYAMIIIMLLPALLAAQPFEFVQELDSIPVVVDGDTLPAPWLGGYTETCPRTVDLDGDGDLDLLVAWQNGKIEHWENMGTPYQASYALQDRTFLGLDVGYIAKLAIWDMDADGDSDLLVRGAYPMMVLENIGSPINPQFEVIEDSLRDNEGNFVSGYTFDAADIDADGDEDLFFGLNSNGIRFYQNIGDSSQYNFFFMTSTFAGINAGWYASPYFCDIDADGDLDLFIGTWAGKISFYRNEGTPQQYNYVLISNQWMGINVAEFAIPEFCDIDADGDLDLIVGKHNNETHTVPGDMHFYRNIGTAQDPQMVLENQMYLIIDFEDGSEPGIIDVNFDARGDLFVHAFYVSWLKDVGFLQNPVYELQSYNAAGTGFLASYVAYGDLNGDNHEDMVVASGWSTVLQFWSNDGDTITPGFYYSSSLNVGLPVGGPLLADMDGDGDNDLIVHVDTWTFDHYLYYYENQGTPERFNFYLWTTNYQGWAGDFGVLSIHDFDQDGDFDVVAKDSLDNLVFFENIGNPQGAIFAPPYPMNFVNFDIYDVESCDFSDVDHDGDMDAFFGSILGGIKFYRNVTGEIPGVRPGRQATAPYRGPVLSIGPNPANPLTIISCQLPAASSLSLEIFDISGKKVMELASGFHLPGEYRYVWDASKNASGMYVIRLQTPQFNTSQKLTIVK